MNKMFETIFHVCQAIEHSAKTNYDPNHIATLATATDTLGKTFAILKEVEIHEKFHLAQESLPGEDISFTN